jgi:hypothetical protein
MKGKSDRVNLIEVHYMYYENKIMKPVKIIKIRGE